LHVLVDPRFVFNNEAFERQRVPHHADMAVPVAQNHGTPALSR